MTAAPKQSGNNHQRDNREQDQQTNFPFRRRVGEQPKSRAAILYVSDVEDALDDRDAVVQRNISCD